MSAFPEGKVDRGQMILHSHPALMREFSVQLNISP